MKIYSIEKLLKVYDNGSEIFMPFLESFARKYSQKVNEDKNRPLFSKTTKYQSFPNNRQKNKFKKNFNSKKFNSKNLDNCERNSKSFSKGKFKIYGKNKFHKNPNKNKFHWRKNSKYEKPIKRNIKKVKTIKGNIIKIMNKITKKNFENQINELIQFLCINKDESTVLIVAKNILQKIWYDSSFYEIYVKVCQELWNNNNWISNSFRVYEKNNKFYFERKFEEDENISCKLIRKDQIFGPFQSEKEATESAFIKNNFKTIFLTMCQQHFIERKNYIKQIKEKKDSSEKYILKRKIFGTLEIIGYFFINNELINNPKIINQILNDLLNQDSDDIEIEAVKMIFVIIKHKLPKDFLLSLGHKIKKIMKQNRTKRIEFMLEDFIEDINKLTKIQKRSEIHSDFNNKFFFPEKDMEYDEIVKLSRKHNNENMNKIIKTITNKHQIPDTSNATTTLKLKEGIDINLVSRIIRDSAEYGEYALNHGSTILSLLKNQDVTKLSFDGLSKALENLTEELDDIKIDAPKAPNNMSLIIAEILKGTKSGKIEINISKTTFSDGSINNNINNRTEEWDNILRLTENNIGKNILSKRFEILKIKKNPNELKSKFN